MLQPPHWSLAVTDAPRALLDFTRLVAQWPRLREMPTGDGHGVMVIPGFLGSDWGNRPLIRYLRHLGYHAIGWQQGRNLGISSFSEDALRESLDALATVGGGKVSLIGHSLGGIYAREIARQEPELIHQVVTLGSPFGKGHDTGSHAFRLYQRLNLQGTPDQREQLLPTPPPVPTTAIYTKGDGIINWRSSVQTGDWPHVHNIEVRGSHIGLNLNPTVWHWLARKLAET